MIEESSSSLEAPSHWPLIRRVVLGFVFVGASFAAWHFVGRGFWRDYQLTRAEERAVEDSTPIGYVGLYYRRTYNARPAQFIIERDGRTLLWAAMDEQGQPTVHFDISHAAFDPGGGLSGGFGMDSIVGVDFPIYERVGAKIARRLPARKAIFVLERVRPPRAYPGDLLKKVEVVNDIGEGGLGPFAIVYSRGANRAELFSRMVDGRALTLGTSGYQFNERPLLYDRRTRSLWLPGETGLDCVAGPLQGKRLYRLDTLEETGWGAWIDDHPTTRVLVGTDREPPIPSE